MPTRPRFLAAAAGLACAGGLFCGLLSTARAPRAVAAGDDPATRPPATSPAPAKADAAPAAASDFSLAVYSTADPATFTPQDLLLETMNNPNAQYLAPGYGVVRETRRMRLAAGVNRVEYADVAAGIDPTTVAFRSLTAPDSTSVLEQNFDYDLAGAGKLIAKYVGKEVVLVPKPPASGKPPEPVRGTLLAFDHSQYDPATAYTVQTNDPREPVVILRGDAVDAVRLAAADKGLVSRPTLNWQVLAKQPGSHDVQVTYQTDGLTWRADYNVVIAKDETTADVSAWVTLLNASGRGYPDAKLKLIAGNVQRYTGDARNRVGTGSGLFGGVAAPPIGFEEKGFFEYHLYTLGRPTTLPNNSTKQIELFPPRSGVPVKKVYAYYGLSEKGVPAARPSPLTDQELGTESTPTVDVYLRFTNAEADHLGVPLPAGRMRLHKVDEADGTREFVGEDVIRHTPKDEPVQIRLGTAFDVVGERKQAEFARENNTITEKFEIVLRNHKAEPAGVVVKENLYRWVNWEIVQSSDPWDKQDGRTIHFPISVPANGAKTVTYTVKYSW